MATIKSGASADYLSIDPANKAARIAVYDSGGTNFYPAYVGGYQARIDVVPTSILTDGTTYWAIRNTGTHTCYLRCINVVTSYIGTSASSRSLFRFERFSTGNPTGGSAIPIAKRDNNDPNSDIGVALVAPSGMTTSAAVFEANGPMIIGVVNQLGTMANFVYDFTAVGERSRFLLAPGEGLALRAYGTVVAGSGVHGSVWWDER